MNPVYPHPPVILLLRSILALILLTWRKGWAANTASNWQMGFNSVFKGLISYNLHQFFQVVSFLQVFPPNPVCISLLYCVPHFHYVILLIWSLSLYAVSRTNREASHYTSFSSPQTFQSSYHMLSTAANLLWNVANGKQDCVSGGNRAAKLRSLVYTEFKEKSRRRCVRVERLKVRLFLSTLWRRIGGVDV